MNTPPPLHHCNAGVEMFGVLIDSQLITRFLAQATTGFVALLSYMLANLDIRKEELCMWDLEMMV